MCVHARARGFKRVCMCVLRDRERAMDGYIYIYRVRTIYMDKNPRMDPTLESGNRRHGQATHETPLLSGSHKSITGKKE